MTHLASLLMACACFSTVGCMSVTVNRPTAKADSDIQIRLVPVPPVVTVETDVQRLERNPDVVAYDRRRQHVFTLWREKSYAVVRVGAYRPPSPIRPVALSAPRPTPQPVVAAAPPAPPAPVRHEHERIVHFDTARHALKAAEQQQLDELVSAIESGQVIKIAVIEGHADSRGSEQFNDVLSSRRAQAVRDYLASKGIAPDQFEIQPKGETQPVASNADPAGQALNRRAHVRIVSESQPTAASTSHQSTPAPAGKTTLSAEQLDSLRNSLRALRTP